MLKEKRRNRERKEERKLECRRTCALQLRGKGLGKRKGVNKTEGDTPLPLWQKKRCQNKQRKSPSTNWGGKHLSLRRGQSKHPTQYRRKKRRAVPTKGVKKKGC